MTDTKTAAAREEPKDVETLPLRRPITVHGDDGPTELRVLTLKLPSGRTVLRLGEPFTTKIESDGVSGSKIEFKVIAPLAAEYLSEMTGVNPILLGQLHPLDVLAAFDLLVRMLRPTVA